MLNQIFALHEKPHAVIVKLTSLSCFDSFLKEYMKSIVCNINPPCNKCQWCKKIDNNNYFDLQVFDAMNIKKQDALNLIASFTKTGLESKNKKFYVIKNIENVNKQVANSLLKFIEEPPKNVYAIFTTKSYNSILSTIKSRCIFFVLKSNKDMVEQMLSKYDKDIQAFFINLSEKQYIELSNLKKYIEMYSKFIKTIEYLISSNYLDVINEVTQFLKKSDIDEKKFFFEIIKQKVEPKVAIEITKMQSLLSLNLSHTLLLNNLLKLLNH